MKFKKYLFIALLSSIFMINANAATLSFEKNSMTIKQNEASDTININLKTDDNESINNIEFTLSYNNSLVTVKANDNDTGFAWASNNNIIKVLDPTENKTKLLTGTIYSFKITNISAEDGSDVLELKDVKVDGTDYTEEIKPVTITLKKAVVTTTAPKNTSAKLTNFTVANATIKPAFSENIKDYKIYVNKDSIRQITIRPSFEASGVTTEVVCILGCQSDSTTPNKLNLTMGKNEATFKFTSEDGNNTETYNFTIYRGETTDGSNLLASLVIEGFELNEKFDKSNLDYTLTVPYETEKLNITTNAEDENADIKIKGDEKLVVGENVITITVTSAETEEKKIYNITVTREEFNPEENTATKVGPVIETKKNKKKTLLIIIIALVSTLIIGTAAYFIFFKKKFKKNKKKTNIPEVEVNEKKEIGNAIIDEDKEPTSVEEALADLMKTKEMEIKD